MSATAKHICEKTGVFTALTGARPEDINIFVAGGGFQAAEHSAELLAETIFNERAGFKYQRAEIAVCALVNFQEINGNVRNSPGMTTWGVAVLLLFISLALKMTGVC
ncbi:hypothetical protein ACR9GP_21465 [Enterobacter ludwigii]